MKTCFSFASLDNDSLPPLFVPEFRWWQCSGCIPDAGMKRTTEKKEVVTKGDTDTSSCENIGIRNGLRENTGWC